MQAIKAVFVSMKNIKTMKSNVAFRVCKFLLSYESSRVKAFNIVRTRLTMLVRFWEKIAASYMLFEVTNTGKAT